MYATMMTSMNMEGATLKVTSARLGTASVTEFVKGWTAALNTQPGTASSSESSTTT